jgi:serine protease Do
MRTHSRIVIGGPVRGLAVACVAVLVVGCGPRGDQPTRARPAAAPDAGSVPAAGTREAAGAAGAGATEQPGAGARQPSLASLAPLVESVKSTVVNVEVVARAPAPTGPQIELFERFFGTPPGGPGQGGAIQRGAGSGVIVDPRGLVVTNNHVVEHATSIRVRLDPRREFEAEVLGRDPLTDLALLRLKGDVKDLPAARLGDSERLRVGDWVVAIGNPFGLASSVSAGIISGEGRDIRLGPYDDFLQTDAAINPGNSGGPLFNLDREVVGINTAIVGGGSGIGFAIPSRIVKALLPQLERGEEIARGWLGVAVQDLTPTLAQALRVEAQGGAIVSGVADGSPAARAGLRPDDVIVALDGKPLQSSRDLTRAVGFAKPGTVLTLTTVRGGERREVRVELGRRPDLEARREPAPERESTETVGLTIADVDPRIASQLGIPPRGALVTRVRPGSAAEEAGLAPGMVIVEAGGKPLASARDLARAIRDGKGSVLLLRVQVPEGRFLRALQIPG